MRRTRRRRTPGTLRQRRSDARAASWRGPAEERTHVHAPEVAMARTPMHHLVKHTVGPVPDRMGQDRLDSPSVIRSLDANVRLHHGDSSHNHLRDDSILVNPPFNMSDCGRTGCVRTWVGFSARHCQTTPTTPGSSTSSITSVPAAVPASPRPTVPCPPAATACPMPLNWAAA